MSSFENPVSHPGALSTPPTWARILLGTVLIVAGLLVLADVSIATLISAYVIGLIAVVTGVFEILHAFWTKGWGGLLWRILLGALYVAFGLVLMNQPLAGALFLTYVLGLVLLLSGAVRLFLSYNYWAEAGWIMLLSGAFGVLAGLVILTGFPKTGLWVLGLLLGIDLMCHGVAWLVYAPSATAKAA